MQNGLVMPRLSTDKLQLLKKAFTEDAMSPGQAAQATGITYATAKRYYELWGDEIKRSLESRLVPELEASVERHLKKQKAKWLHAATDEMLKAVHSDWQTWKKDGYA